MCPVSVAVAGDKMSAGVTGAMGITQVTLFQQPAVRRALGMTPLLNAEQARRDAIDRGLVKEDKTINVQAKSRPATQKPLYQAPTIRYTDGTTSTTRDQAAQSAEPAAPTNPIEKASGWFANTKKQLVDRLADAQAQAGARSGKKQSKTRSAEYMKRAEAYERRWKNSR